MQSMDNEFSSSSFRWLCRDTWRCRVAMSVTYFMLYDGDTQVSLKLTASDVLKRLIMPIRDKSELLTVGFYHGPIDLSGQ